MTDSLWVGLSLATILALVHFLIRPVFFSPLSKIPSAHWSAPFSPLWILYARKSGRENSLLLDAHRSRGKVVRVGPRALSIDGVDAIRTVYQGGFDKDPWYSVFDNYGVPCMFSARTSRHHSARKRMIANVYSKSYIQTSEAAKAQAEVILLRRLLPLLNASAVKHQGIDVHSIFLATTMDLISAYVFGIDSSTNLIQDESYRQHWLQLYNSRNEHHFWPQELPSLTQLFRRLGIHLYPSWVDDANAELSQWNWGLCEKAAKSDTRSGPRYGINAETAVVMDTLEKGIDKERTVNGSDSILFPTMIRERKLSVASELFDHVLAGQETAGVTLTYLCWHMSQNLRLQSSLRQELSAVFEDGQTTLPNPKVLDELPLLQGVIMETLRLHAPIPGPQPRSTPYPSCNIEGYVIPGGVRVAGLAHSLHRDPTVFPEPLKWDHRRWLVSSSSEEDRRQRNRYMWAFSSGGRMCIGSNFAMNEMKQIVALIYSHFTTHIVNDEGIEQTDGYTARPRSEKLVLRFEATSSTN